MFPKERQRRVSWDSQSKVRIVCVCLFWTGLLIRRAELLKINHYKAPRDKMICILNCCKVIFGQSTPWLVPPLRLLTASTGLIRNVYGAETGGADAFVPILIFVVLRANPENLISNLEYVVCLAIFFWA